MLLGQPYNHKVDFWALGCTLHEVLTGCSPFAESNVMELVQNILTGRVSSPPQPIGMQAHRAIAALLQRDVGSRVGSSAELCAREPFFHPSFHP